MADNANGVADFHLKSRIPCSSRYYPPVIFCAPLRSLSEKRRELT
ncbi:hypothetical protein Mycsm_03328 [Mycobacterium sp. JS623]|nr:hypothetical protein Mycsm_03328 [Mycobacterium sp. JS623]